MKLLPEELPLRKTRKNCIRPGNTHPLWEASEGLLSHPQRQSFQWCQRVSLDLARRPRLVFGKREKSSLVQKACWRQILEVTLAVLQLCCRFHILSPLWHDQTPFAPVEMTKNLDPWTQVSVVPLPLLCLWGSLHCTS